jgi:sulfur-carrier protein
MPTVRIPPVLRSQTGDRKQVEVEGDTVGAVLRSLAEQHPDLRQQLFGDDGSLNRFVNVYLNDQDIRYLGELETAVDARDTVVILPAMAGGVR